MSLVRSQLGIQMSQIHPVLRLPRRRIHPIQEIVEQLQHLRNQLMIRIILRRRLQNRLQQQRIPPQPRRRSSQEPVQLDLPRLGSSFDLVHELDELGVVEFLLLELVFPVLLMTSVVDEGLEERDAFEEDVSDGLDDGLGTLTFGEEVGEDGVVGEDGGDVPEDLGDEGVSTFVGLDDVAGSKRFDPELGGWQMRGWVGERGGGREGKTEEGGRGEKRRRVEVSFDSLQMENESNDHRERRKGKHRSHPSNTPNPSQNPSP